MNQAANTGNGSSNVDGQAVPAVNYGHRYAGNVAVVNDDTKDDRLRILNPVQIRDPDAIEFYAYSIPGVEIHDDRISVNVRKRVAKCVSIIVIACDDLRERNGAVDNARETTLKKDLVTKQGCLRRNHDRGRCQQKYRQAESSR